MFCYDILPKSRSPRLHATFHVHIVSMNMYKHRIVNGWRSEAAGVLAIENTVDGQLPRNFEAHKKSLFSDGVDTSSRIHAKYYT